MALVGEAWRRAVSTSNSPIDRIALSALRQLVAVWIERDAASIIRDRTDA